NHWLSLRRSNFLRSRDSSSNNDSRREREVAAKNAKVGATGRAPLLGYDCLETRTSGPVGAAVVPTGSRVTAKVSIGNSLRVVLMCNPPCPFGFVSTVPT